MIINHNCYRFLNIHGHGHPNTVPTRRYRNVAVAVMLRSWGSGFPARLPSPSACRLPALRYGGGGETDARSFAVYASDDLAGIPLSAVQQNLPKAVRPTTNCQLG